MNGLLNADKEAQSVMVEAPARLHLGFMDLNGATGRRFGSLGLALDGFSTRIYAERAESTPDATFSCTSSGSFSKASARLTRLG